MVDNFILCELKLTYRHGFFTIMNYNVSFLFVMLKTNYLKVCKYNEKIF